MNDDSTGGSNRPLALLILASLMIHATATVLDLGLSNSPYDTVDRFGRPMGFNSPLYTEHYAIMLENFRLGHLFRLRRWYDWLLVAAQMIGAVLLLCKSTSSHIQRWYFIAQWLFFPLGALFFLMAPGAMFGLASGRPRFLDREDFTDMHLAMVTAQGCWLWVATIIACFMKGPALKLRKPRRRTDCLPQ